MPKSQRLRTPEGIKSGRFFPPLLKNPRLLQDDAREASTLSYKILDRWEDRSHDYEAGGRYGQRSPVRSYANPAESLLLSRP